MFRAALRLSVSGVRSLTRSRPQCTAPLGSRCYSHGSQETDEEFDARWITYFNKPDIDAWELRKGMNTLIGYDLVPEPKILEAALRACRRLNDLASAVRILEAVKVSGTHSNIWFRCRTKLDPTKRYTPMLSKNFDPRLMNWASPHLRSWALTKHRLLPLFQLGGQYLYVDVGGLALGGVGVPVRSGSGVPTSIFFLRKPKCYREISNTWVDARLLATLFKLQQLCDRKVHLGGGMVDNSSSSKAQMDGSLAGAFSQTALGGAAGVKLEAVMEQLQRQQQAKLEMERKERHLSEAHLLYAQQLAAQQAIMASARGRSAPLTPDYFNMSTREWAPKGSQGPQSSTVSAQSSMDSEREEGDGGMDKGRASAGEEDEDDEMMDGEEGSEDDEGEGLEFLRKQSLALQQAGMGVPPYPFPVYAASPPAVKKRTRSPPPKVKDDPEGSPSPADQHSFNTPNGLADWNFEESLKQALAPPMKVFVTDCNVAGNSACYMGLSNTLAAPHSFSLTSLETCCLTVPPRLSELSVSLPLQNGGVSWNEESDGGRGRGEASRDFAKLYELDSDSNRKEFLDDLFTFMQKRGTPVNRIPIMAKQVLDLYKLYKLVTEKGGLVEVINKKIWREITKGLNLPTSITSAAFTLRTQYMKYLYPYECEKKGLSSPGELQAAIDSNRREGRRPGYSSSLYRFSPSQSGGAPHLLSPPKMHLPSSGHNGLQSTPTPGLKKETVLVPEEGPPMLPGRLPLALALGHQQQLARAATLEQLRDRLETSIGPVALAAGAAAMEGPERKMARLAEEQQRLLQQAFQQNLLAMASQVNPASLRVNSTSAREEKQDLSLSISSNGSASITVSVEVNGVIYSGSLYAQKSQAAMPTSVMATSVSQRSTLSPSVPSSSSSSSSSSKGCSSVEPTTAGSP
ncbi:hypothetical protein P4O66_015684 [Electrophorus voltai]|uniref:AT-rich interactive domain-containing protein 3 n=1 Tax=Electrophorus voltai TaxID=2609070 RepID=A0AAD8Z1L7_9TELE|nr:hypothetical protein P4O66_015684 [Electrophorus voltai]